MCIDCLCNRKFLLCSWCKKIKESAFWVIFLKIWIVEAWKCWFSLQWVFPWYYANVHESWISVVLMIIFKRSSWLSLLAVYVNLRKLWSRLVHSSLVAFSLSFYFEYIFIEKSKLISYEAVSLLNAEEDCNLIVIGCNLSNSCHRSQGEQGQFQR